MEKAQRIKIEKTKSYDVYLKHNPEKDYLVLEIIPESKKHLFETQQSRNYQKIGKLVFDKDGFGIIKEI